MLSMRSSQQQKNPMIKSPPSPKPVLKFMFKLLLFNWLVSACRISLIIMIYVFKNIFLAKNPWDYLIFTMIGLVDTISLLGEINTYKVLRQEEKVLLLMESQRQQMIVPVESPRFGNFESYLSTYETLYNYKYKYNATSSSYSIIRYLHFISSFAIFGSLALRNITVEENADIDTSPSLLKQMVLFLTLLSVYINCYEVDYGVMEKSNGKYQCIEKISPSVANQITNKFIFWRKVLIGTYLLILTTIVTSMGLIITREVIMNYLSLVIIVSVTGGFVIANIIVEINFVREARNNPALTLKQDSTENICSIYQLLHQLKAKAPEFHVVISSGLRLAGFSLYMMTMVDSSNLQVQTISLLILSFCLIILSQIFKFLYGHKSRVDYLQPITLSIEERIQQTCSICLSNYVDNKEACQLPCTADHMFHFGCIKDWMKNKKECPLCRYDLSQFFK